MDGDNINKMSDHDLLVVMHEQIRGVKEQIKELKEGTANKILDHETRIRRLEMWGAIAIGVSYALNFYFNYLK